MTSINRNASYGNGYFTNKAADGADVYRGAEGKYEQAKTLLNDLEELKSDIQNNPDLSDVRKRVLTRDIQEGINAAKTALDLTTRGGEHEGVVQDGIFEHRGDGEQLPIRDALTRADSALRAALDETKHVPHQAADGPNSRTYVMKPQARSVIPGEGAGKTEAKKVDDDCPVHGSEGSSGAESADKSGKSAKSDGASKSKKSGDSTFGTKSPDELMELMQDDPEALMAHLDGMSDREAEITMQHMQQRMQSVNRMMSMMSSLAKAAHDTSKSVINNMRV